MEPISGSIETSYEMTTSTSTKASITVYKNTTRDNALDWKRTLDAHLAEKDLLTVVTDGQLAKRDLLKLKLQYKSLDETWTSDIEKEHIKESNTTAYHIILATIGDKTTRQTVERLHPGDGLGAREYVLSQWTVDGSDGEVQEARQLIGSKGRFW